MKKTLALLVVFALFAFALVGCKPKKDTLPDGELKTGMAVISSLSSSKEVGEEDGLAQSDANVVAVTVDGSGKIVKCVIDAVQSKINFDATGKLVTDKTTMVKTKNELGDEYNMKSNSKIGKEWNEQAAALAKYVEGKTVSEVKGIALNEKGAATGADLTASVTMSISGYIKAIEKAVANASALGAKDGDKLGLGIVTNIAGSADAGEKDGLAQTYSTYAAVTFAADGTITSCAIDASQNDVKFSTAGKITTDLTAAPKTKNELGEAYNMKSKSGIGKEWNEQAAAFAKYVTGKTTAKAAAISIDENSKATDADLKASVTITVGDFMAVIEKAAASAK